MIKQHFQGSSTDPDSQPATAADEYAVKFKPPNPEQSQDVLTYFPTYHIQPPVSPVDTQTAGDNHMDPSKPAVVWLPRSDSRFKYISWDEPWDFNSSRERERTFDSRNLRQLANVKHPPLANRVTCRDWSQNRCSFGSRCKRVHGDLNNYIPDPETSAVPPLPEPRLSITFHDHTRVKIGPGFEVLEVTPSVETPCIIISNVPARIKANAIKQLLSPFGSVVDVQLETPESLADSTMIAKVRLARHGEAVQACQSLHGSTFENVKISAQLVPVNSQPRKPPIQNCSAQIQWEAPHKVGYGGYPSLEKADEAMTIAAQGPSEDYHVSAAIHVGLPSVGTITVKFTNLPPTADEGFMQRFAAPDDIMWERPNYTALAPAMNGIQNILRRLPNFVQLEVHPPPYSHGLICAWATFSSPAAAKAGARVLNGQTPFFTGNTRIWARHVYSTEYRSSVDDYAQNAHLIDSLGESIFQDGGMMAVSTRKLPSSSMLIRLSAGELKQLGYLQAEVVKILRGEIIRCDGIAVWDTFFARPEGLDYLRSVEVNEPGVRIEADKVKRTLKAFGAASGRAAVRTVLVQKVADLKAERTSIVRVPGCVLGAFIATPLCEKFGSDNISGDIEERTVTLRGGDDLSGEYEEALEAVTQTQQSPLNDGECLVCFSTAVAPITLRCGHTWCHENLIKYLLAAALDSLHFPLPCLDANCSEPISLQIARDILRPNEFNALVEAAIGVYMQAHGEQFQYCPSSGCMQIYCTSAELNTVIRCASCLMSICPHCHSEAHEGFLCAEQGLE